MPHSTGRVANPADRDRQRLDRELVRRGLAASRQKAQTMIAAGSVRVDGDRVDNPARLVEASAVVEAEPERYVSRAAYKLLGALDELAVTVPHRALDGGASTGGFTQVLLERGAKQVTCVDVGTAQLAPRLRADPRVRVYEQTNLRDLTVHHVGGSPVGLVVADVSFISLTLLLEPLSRVVAPDGDLLLLVKPQFEVGRTRLGKGGVVRTPQLHADAVAVVIAAAAEHGWHAHAAAPSRLPGPAGNREFFVRFRTGSAPALDLRALVTPT